QLQDKAGAFRQTTAEDAPVLSATDQSLAFAALASLYRQTRDASHGRAAALAQNAAWRAAAQSRAHSAMPWLLIGEGKLHGLEVPAVDGALSRAQRNDITRQMLALAMEHQITVLPGRDVAPDDVLGGFDFSEPVP